MGKNKEFSIKADDTRFKRIDDDTLFEYVVIYVVGIVLIMTIVYLSIFGYNVIDYVRDRSLIEGSLLDAWLDKDIARTTNIAACVGTVMMPIVFIVTQIFRWCVFYTSGTTFVYRDEAWSTQVSVKSVLVVSSTVTIFTAISLFLCILIGLIITIGILQLFVHVFNVVWVTSFIVISSIFTIMTIIRHRNRMRYKTQMAIEGSADE